MFSITWVRGAGVQGFRVRIRVRARFGFVDAQYHLAGVHDQ